MARLRSWQQAGARRAETSSGSHSYTNAAAIRLFDAWWPRLVADEFQPILGPETFGALTSVLKLDEAPSQVLHRGSAYQEGWWGYVDSDLRSVLGDPVAGGLGRTHCGGGDLAGCRQVLLATLQAAAATPANSTYPADANCSAGDQRCADSIVQSPLGGITHASISWQNRPTYQQVVSFPTRRGVATVRRS